MLADTQVVEDYMCSPGQVSQYAPTGVGGQLAHTNHPLSNTKRIDPEQISEDFRGFFGMSNEHSSHRFTCLELRYYGASGAVEVEDINHIPSSHEPPEFPVCHHPQARVVQNRCPSCT